jgi:hypothetical protein
MGASTTISVPIETRDLLNDLAQAEGVSTSALVTRIAQREHDNRLLDAMNAGFATLRGDRERWEEHQTETEAWDNAAPEL